jgi:hypothetical protein
MPYSARSTTTTADAARARRQQLEGHHAPAVDRDHRRLPALALHATPPHARASAPPSGSNSTTLRPRRGLEGLEDRAASQWQRQLHLFSVPFYYIEYGIAQLGARCSVQPFLSCSVQPSPDIGDSSGSSDAGTQTA